MSLTRNIIYLIYNDILSNYVFSCRVSLLVNCERVTKGCSSPGYRQPMEIHLSWIFWLVDNYGTNVTLSTVWANVQVKLRVRCLKRMEEEFLRAHRVKLNKRWLLWHIHIDSRCIVLCSSWFFPQNIFFCACSKSFFFFLRSILPYCLLKKEEQM